jgi:hypothetical protein
MRSLKEEGLLEHKVGNQREHSTGMFVVQFCWTALSACVSRVQSIVDKDGDYYRKPEEFAMHHYQYFQCYDCKKVPQPGSTRQNVVRSSLNARSVTLQPYFAGAAVCGEAGADIDRKELLCVP